MEQLLKEVLDLERGGQLSEKEDIVREETIMEIVEIIKKYIK